MIVKLKDLGEIITGNTPSKSNEEYYESKDIGFVKPDVLPGSYIEKRINPKEYISEKARKKSRIAKEDSILVSCIGNIGKIGIVKNEVAFNQQINAIMPNNRMIDTCYLAYCLYYNRNKLEAIANAPVVPIINKTQFQEFQIQIDNNIDIQKNIVEILDKISNIIDSKKKQLILLEELIKARFVEAFGDPIKNDKVWPVCSVENLCVDIYGGGTPSKSHPEYYENGDIPWISSKDMKTEILYDSQIHINALGVENSTARIVPINSIIMVIRSGILKHTLPVAINAVPVTVNQDLKVFIPGNQIDPRFMAIQFKLIEKDILSGVRAVTADNIEFNSLKQRKLIVPDLELQKRFVLFVKQIDKSKVAIQKSLDETQLLFDSLMQKYFG